MPVADFIIIESHYVCSNVEILILSRIIHFTSFLVPRSFHPFSQLFCVCVCAFAQLFRLCFSHFFNAFSWKRIVSSLLCLLCYQFIQHSNLNCKVSLRAKCFYANSLHFSHSNTVELLFCCFQFFTLHFRDFLYSTEHFPRLKNTQHENIYSTMHTAIQSGNFKANDFHSVLFYVLKVHETNSDYFFGWQNKQAIEKHSFFSKI